MGAHILVTGANGFIGRALVRRLLASGLGGEPIERLVASDLALDGLARDARLQRFEGSISDAGQLERLLVQPVDVVFHLAGVPCDVAEREPEVGRRVNLDATVRLLKLLGRQASAPRLVFASSAAVYGGALPEDRLDERMAPEPGSSQGAQKLAAEVLIADAARRGAVDACSLRLPPVVARRAGGTPSRTAAMSQLLMRLARGEPVVMPAAADTHAWWLSVGACVDSLLQAATLDGDRLPPSRVVQVPALHLSLQAVVDALVRAHGADRRTLVRFKPPTAGQPRWPACPPLHTPRAEALGFCHDGDADTLVRRAVEGVAEPESDAEPGAMRPLASAAPSLWAAWPASVSDS